MDARIRDDGLVELTVNRVELRIIGHWVYEATVRIDDDDDYSTMVGATREETRALDADFVELYTRLPPYGN